MAKLNYNKKELEDLLRHFHTLTGMIFTLYDNEGTQLISYPEKYCAFCRVFKKETGMPARTYRKKGHVL